MRIVSLLASATEAACALGLEDRIVGISHECDHPPEILDRPRGSRPRFDPAGLSSGAIDAAVRATMLRHGSVYELDAELLRRLAPDLILAQAVCEVCAVPTSLAVEAARAVDGAPHVLSLDSHSVEDILAGIEAIGAAAGIAAHARDVVRGLRERLDRIRGAVDRRRRPSVLALEWLDPPFLPGHWTPEMIEIAGGIPLLAESRVPSRRVGWDALEGTDPDVLLLMPCGYDLAAARHDAARHGDRLGPIASRAVSREAAWVLDGSACFNRSGPRMVEGVEVLGAILHPECVPASYLRGRAAVWAPAG